MAVATELQTRVLRAVLRNDYGAFNGGVPDADYVFKEEHFQVWSECVDCTRATGLPTGRSLSATIGSCVANGLLKSDGECVWLTKAGFDIAREAAD